MYMIVLSIIVFLVWGRL